uniref:Uncharacterized protein n=1 Tax=Moniliophthora roreri TaxID=221103 RepID=A0A0W0F2H1_MONRR
MTSSTGCGECSRLGVCHSLCPSTQFVDISALPHLLSSAQRDLAAFDTEIERISHILRKLVEGRTETQKYIDELQIRLSPVFRLPLELLQVIFTEASILGPCTDILSKNICPPPKFLGNGAGIAPFNIAGVCRHWRDIAFDMPRLWSSFSLSLDSKSVTSSETLHKLELHLKRSQNLPLALRIHGNYFIRVITYGNKDEIGPLTSVLASSALRWASLEIASPSIPEGWDSHVATFFDLLDSDTVGLPTSDLHTIHTLTVNEPPYLTSRKLQTCRALFANVTSLTISPRHKLHRVWCTGILYAMPLLEHLAIELIGVPDDVLAIGCLTLPKVKSLSVAVRFPRGNPHDALAVIFDGFTLPSLTSLSIECEHDLKPANQWPGPEAVDFLVRSGCNLRSLELKRIRMSEQESEEFSKVAKVSRSRV